MAFRREVYSQRSTRLNSGNPYQIRPPASSSGALLSSSHLISPAPAHRPAFRGSEPDGPINEYGIYCGNLAWDVTSEMLKEYLSLIGPLESCEVFLNYDGRSKGSGLAKFESKESATRAINELNDTDFHGRLLQIRPDREKPKRDDDKPPTSMPLSERQIPPGIDSRRVYVGNLGWGVAWQDLKDHMRKAGEVIRAEIMQGPGGRSKGCGIVEYASADEARYAIASLHDTELQGRLILVRQDKDDGRQALSQPQYPPVLPPIGPYNMGNMGNMGPPGYGMSERWNQYNMMNQTPMWQQHQHQHQGPPQHHQQHSLYSTPSGLPVPQLLSPRLYVGNLVYEVTWQELKDHMRSAGEVIRVDLKMAPDGVRNKGCGIIEFRDITSAQRALALLSDSPLRGRPIFLREDREDRRMLAEQQRRPESY